MLPGPIILVGQRKTYPIPVSAAGIDISNELGLWLSSNIRTSDKCLSLSTQPDTSDFPGGLTTSMCE